jgi:DNA-binding transcriptional MerR regulator
MATATGLKIGDVSRQTGISVGALRYYESLGLLRSSRGDNGYRYYPVEAVQQVQFIKKAQALDFSLEDIGEVLNVHQNGDVPCEFVQALLQDKIERLEAQVKEILAFKVRLEQYRDNWAEALTHPQPGDICPLIETVTLQSEA